MYQPNQQTPQQQQVPLSPHPYKVPARNTSSGSGSTPLNVGLASSPSNFDLEPITYPAHLAQTRPPEVGGIVQPLTAGATGSSTATSTSGAGSPNTATGESGATSPGAPAVPARSAHRYDRDISALGSGTAALASAMNLTTSGLAANAVNTPAGPPPSNNSQSAATPSMAGSGFASQNGGTMGGPSTATSSSSIAQSQQPSMGGVSQGSGDSTPTVGPSGSGNQPSGASRSSASRKTSNNASSSGRRAASGTAVGADKDGEDGSADDVQGKRRGESGTSRGSRRPPKARERDHANAANLEGDGDNLLSPVLPTAKVPRAPASAMYFSPVAAHGRPPGQALRAHTGTLVGDRMWFLGGVDARSCWRGVASFDTESLQWSTVETHGESLPPLRAHTTTLVGDQLYIFGGGDGPTYSNDVWVFDTVTRRFSRPVIATPRANLPPPRRAHTTVLYRNFLVVFGGGNGQAALNDVWALDVSDPSRLTWHEWRTRGDVPQKKGYHTANLVGDKMIVFGGSDGHASFADVHVLNLQTLTWTLVNTEVKHNRLSHTATQVGSYLFVIGGHNGQTYAQDVLLFNLVTLAWEQKIPKGVPPPGRGYHVAVLHDGRIFISGGYNGVSVFDDLWALDLGAGAYLPQVTTFEVDENAEHLHPPAPPSKNGSRI